jgi:hypothetical protein
VCDRGDCVQNAALDLETLGFEVMFEWYWFVVSWEHDGEFLVYAREF